jgi:CRISPR-associated endonuclease/helicase Cas3
MMEFYAHSIDGLPPNKWQKLEDHLMNTSQIAEAFAAEFGASKWGRIVGLWHDLGKYDPKFQNKLMVANGYEAHLETKTGRVIHSQAGGHLAQLKCWKGIDRIVSWLIMGHHAGLADWSTDISAGKALEPKMRTPHSSAEILKLAPATITDQNPPAAPKPLLNKADISFFIRMLFSCLVDADFLDTEAFMNKALSEIRRQTYPTIQELLALFDEYIDALCEEAESTPVNAVRSEVLSQCRTKALEDSTVFSLTVPTGGGKTLSSLAFALKHAVECGKRRIIYVIPFTSIIEQTADVFRRIPGFGNAVLEHHCNVSRDDDSEASLRSRLAAENWDAPLIVTTSVQFFESLYANRTSRCRKLHNIANSVIIFDEAQCFPPGLLRPIVFTIKELHRHYGVTPVLCTATQPVLTRPDQFDFQFKEAFDFVTEIAAAPERLATDLKRVEVETFNGILKPVTYSEIADAIVQEEQSVLCIVNSKVDCRTLAGLLPKEQTVHLSTSMCAAHRLKKFDSIKKRLKHVDQPLYVISTSLVEAGVDLDFPVVYRALSGLDSIAQAAGRCNREGLLPGLGRTVVFEPPSQPRYVAESAAIAREYLDKGNLEDLFSPENFRSYFKLRYWQLGDRALDEKGILGLLSGHLDYYFHTAAQRFEMINSDWQAPIIVPYENALDLASRLERETWHYRELLRRLQRYTINLPSQIHRRLIDEGYAREIAQFPGTFILEASPLYDSVLGFLPPEEMVCYEPADIMI